MIEFLWPWVFYLLPLPLLVIWFLPAARREEAALHVPFFSFFSDFQATTQIRVNQSLIRRLVLLLIWLALILGSARPQWVGDPIQLPATGRDLMLAVDISGSMGNEDMQLNNRTVNRLQVVKGVVGDFVEKRKGDRIGLILFGDRAYLQTPLTFDRHTVRTLLMETPLGIAGQKTAIGDAIGLAVKRLESRPAESRILILLTDGVNNAGEVSPLQAAKLAQQEGIKIYTIGFGSDQLQVQGLLFNRQINPSAELDVKTLTKIAEQTGGLFQRARSGRELRAIYQELNRLEPVDQDQETFRPIKSLFFWPLSLALIASFLLVLSHPSSVAWLAQIFSHARSLSGRAEAVAPEMTSPERQGR